MVRFYTRTLKSGSDFIRVLNHSAIAGWSSLAARRARTFTKSNHKMKIDTKLKGDVAEYAAILEALNQGWGVLSPIGDRKPYDLVFDVGGVLIKIQVKCAWFDRSSQNFVVDNRRTKTNRRIMLRERYQKEDFDFALVYIPQNRVFYIFPVTVFIGYGSEIHLVETAKRQRKPRSAEYREAWHLILKWATHKETYA